MKALSSIRWVAGRDIYKRSSCRQSRVLTVRVLHGTAVAINGTVVPTPYYGLIEMLQVFHKYIGYLKVVTICQGRRV